MPNKIIVMEVKLTYSYNQLTEIYKKSPNNLAKLLLQSSNVHTISDGIEILSNECSDEDVVLPVLKKFLSHIHVLVREAACNAVSSFYSASSPPEEIIGKLKTMSETDPSGIIKSLATDILGNIK